jgi:hypothetical protein
MNQQVNTLLRKEVSRKEFLGMSGLAVASIFGFGTLIKLLSSKQSHSHSMLSGYGSSPYGGKPNL